jgi:selenocysteine-specific elongation factor
LSMRKKTTHLINGIRARAVIGTAGHIDHGKTTLVRKLTGIDTDRLGEEKARGISIELGFAFLETEEGRIAIIDVPGHERFVRQMIAGAAGIDLVLLVIAADEGVMPQTLEHLDICNILGVSHGAVVLTKTDLVDADWLSLVKEDITEQLAGTFLEGCEMIEFAAEDEDLRQSTIQSILALVDRVNSDPSVGQRHLDRLFKLSIDRVFSMRGFGTVVTGTTASGSISVGDTVRLLPQGESTRVRGIQVHGEHVERVLSGSRAAINLQNVDHHSVSRAEVLSCEHGFNATTSFDGTLVALKRLSKSIRNRAKVLVHVGTAQIQGTLVILGQDEIQPGEKGYVQVRLDNPTAILPGEPYVIRGFEVLAQYGKTLGGGKALLPSPAAHRKKSTHAIELLRSLDQKDPAAMLLGWLKYNGHQGVDKTELSRTIPCGDEALSHAIERLTTENQLVQISNHLHLQTVLEAMKARTKSIVATFHQENPARIGMSLEEARSRVEADFPSALIPRCLDDLSKEGSIEQDGERVRLKGFTPTRSAKQTAHCEKILSLLTQGGLTPSRTQDLPEELGMEQGAIKEAMELLIESEEVIRVTKELTYASAPLKAFEKLLIDYLKTNQSIDTAALKELTGASRKWTIPLGEYFDTIRLTVRVGDRRQLREQT